MPKVLFLIGMPGSGKSTYLADFLKLHPEFDVNAIYDDYHNKSLDNTHEFTKSRYYRDFVEKLKNGTDCMLVDIEYCGSYRLNLALQGIENIAKEHKLELSVEYLCFENNPQKCRRNVMNRNRANSNEELQKIDRLTRSYNIPEGATILQISN